MFFNNQYWLAILYYYNIIHVDSVITVSHNWISASYCSETLILWSNSPLQLSTVTGTTELKINNLKSNLIVSYMCLKMCLWKWSHWKVSKKVWRSLTRTLKRFLKFWVTLRCSYSLKRVLAIAIWKKSEAENGTLRCSLKRVLYLNLKKDRKS